VEVSYPFAPFYGSVTRCILVPTLQRTLVPGQTHVYVANSFGQCLYLKLWLLAFREYGTIASSVMEGLDIHFLVRARPRIS
jgi:hypothetical protein